MMHFKQNMMGFKQNTMGFKQNIMGFEGFFMVISTLSCSFYMYVGHRDIKLPMHCWLWLFGHYFFIWTKHIIRHFEGLFWGARFTRNNFEIKKVLSSSEKPLKMANYMFFPHNKNVPHFQNQHRINSFLCTCGLHTTVKSGNFDGFWRFFGFFSKMNMTSP